MQTRFRLWPALVTITVVAGCANVAQPLAPDQDAGFAGAVVAKSTAAGPAFAFEATGRLGGSWTGQLSDGTRSARFDVVTRTSTHVGRTVQFTQTWTLYPPDPFIQWYPRHGRQTSIALTGSIDLATGALAATGVTSDGTTVNVEGNALLTASGMVAPGGELMFNPQPEPPRGR